MPADRVQMLKSLIQEDPNDPFLHYGLAMEEAKASPSNALSLFEHLLAKFPDYLPAYYQFALVLVDCGQISKAIEVLQSGAQLAKLQGELKTMGELQTLLDQLGD